MDSPDEVPAEVIAAKEEVDRLRGAASGPPADLARASLALSHAFENADRFADAMAAARDGITGLAPAFRADPGALAQPMRALVAQYVAVARRTDRAPDRTLLAPIAAALGGVVEAEDRAEEAALDGGDDPR